MYITHYVVNIQTNKTGDGIGYTDAPVNGFIRAIRYVKPTAGSFAAGVDFEVTAEQSGVVIWDQDDVNASVTVYPRAAICDTAGVASLYAENGEPVEDLIPIANERVKITVANGGDGGVGTFHVYVG